MTSSRTPAFVVVGVGIALLLVWILMPPMEPARVSPPESIDRAPRSTVEQRAADPRQRIAVAPDVHRQIGTRYLQVLDATDGAAIAGAALVPSGERRFVRRSEIAAITDRRGVLALPEVVDSGTFRVVHSKYRPAELVAAEKRGADLVLRLDRGVGLRVCCYGQDRSPVRGIRVVISRAMIDDPYAQALMEPVDDSSVALPAGCRSSFRSAATDQDGTARFSGLEDGRYVIKLLHESYAVIAGSHYRNGVDVPAVPEVALTVAPVVFAKVIVEGDEIISYTADCPAGFMSTGTLAGYDLEARFRRERSATKNGIAFLGADAGMTDPRVEIDAFLRRSGRVKIKSRLVPIGQYEAPEIVRFQPTGPERCGEVRLRVLEPDGSEVPVSGFFARSGAQRMQLRPGQPVPLEPGEYRLWSVPWLQGYYQPKSFTVVAGQSLEVTTELREHLSPFRIELIEPSGSRCESGLFFVKHMQKKDRMRFFARELTGQTLWYPIGSLTVRAETFGYEPVVGELTLLAGSTDPRVLKLELRPGNR